MKFNYLIFFGLLTIVTFSACKKETIDTSNIFGYDYFPMDIGHTTVYKVDTTFYDEFNDTVFTRSWEIKEEVLLLDKDSEGDDRARIERTIRPWDSTADFTFPRINYATRRAGSLDYQDNNLRFLRLAFPVSNNLSWDGNVYINELIDDNEDLYDDWDYTYQNLDTPFSVGDLSFDETLLVSQVADDEANILTYRFAEERYARGVGLISRTLDNLILKTGNTADYVGIPWPDRANNGYSTTWEIISYETGAIIIEDE